MRTSHILLPTYVLLLCCIIIAGCLGRNTKMDPKMLPEVAIVRRSLPPNFAVAAVLAEGREKRKHRIVNQYGSTLHVIPEGKMFEKAVRDALRTNFSSAHKLTEDSYQNVVVFVDGELDINTAGAKYHVATRLMLLTTDGEEIGRIKMKTSQRSGLINDANAVYNAYLKAINAAIHKILKRHPSYLSRMASLPLKKLPREDSQGTGFFINQNGGILTNFHVVNDCDNVVAYVKGRPYEASPVAFDKQNDLAVVRISHRSKEYPVLEEQGAIMGQEISVFGYGRQNLSASHVETYPSLSTGVISYLGDPVHIHFTAPVQPGNSGSPVINDDGEIVGIVSSSANALTYARQTGTLPQNINRAVRSSVVRRFLAGNNVPFGSGSQGVSPRQTVTVDGTPDASVRSEGKLSKADIARIFNENVVAVRCRYQ